MARSMGIDAFITPEEGRTLAEQSADALGSAPDIVFDCAGVPGSLDQAVSAVRRKGTVASPGFCWAPDTFTPIMAMLKAATICYTNVYDTLEFEIDVGALVTGISAPCPIINQV